ncbi:MAG: cytochrome c maturation protein CcmE [Anaerolineales bacterium]
MAQITWEKTAEQAANAEVRSVSRKRYGYLLVGVVLIGVVAFLFFQAIGTGSYYMTVDELMAAPGDYIDQDARIAGAVDGDTIQFNPETQELYFTIAHIPADNDTIRESGGLARVLYDALQDPDRQRLNIIWHNAEMPDLLQHEAQAIVEGHLGEDGNFYANQVLLKCPTRYSDDVPEQAASSTE